MVIQNSNKFCIYFMNSDYLVSWHNGQDFKKILDRISKHSKFRNFNCKIQLIPFIYIKNWVVIFIVIESKFFRVSWFITLSLFLSINMKLQVLNLAKKISYFVWNRILDDSVITTIAIQPFVCVFQHSKSNTSSYSELTKYKMFTITLRSKQACFKLVWNKFVRELTVTITPDW